MVRKTLQHPTTTWPVHTVASGLLGLLALVMAACEAPSPARPSPPRPRVGVEMDRGPQTQPDRSAPEEEEAAWQAMEDLLAYESFPPPAPMAQPATPTQRGIDEPWHALVLHTFQGDAEGRAAGVWSEQLGILIPPLKPNLGVHVARKGSMVLYGRYDGWDDPKVTEDMTTLKKLRVNGKRIFGPIIRTTVRPQRRPEDIHPHDLLSLRVQFPKVRTMYTLEIEIWGDFDSGALPDEVRRGNAESRVGQLRAEGTPAFYHHNPVNQLSTVTVGAFDETAVDVASGLTSIEVEHWQHVFPNRLTNGETLRLPIQGRPDLGAVLQRSRLVLVPEL